MKQCPTCQEEFADKFGFCPVDGTPLNGHVVTAAPEFESQATPASSYSGVTGKGRTAEEFYSEEETVSSSPVFERDEYHLTFIEDKSLLGRLAEEFRGVAHEYELSWPEFKRDPLGFTRRTAYGYSTAAWRFLSERNVALSVLASFVIVFTLVGTIYALDQVKAKEAAEAAEREQLELVQWVESDIPKEQPTPDPGNAGMNKGSGGGSKPKQEKPGGGGGGGRQEQLPASKGMVLAQLGPQILPPNPHPPKVVNPSLPVIPQIDVDPKLMPEYKGGPIGDLKSTSTVPSSGPGTGGGMGDGTGTGMGRGEGTGYGPGRGGNIGGGDRREGGGGEGGGGEGGPREDYNRPFRSNEVTRKAQITSKPEPNYTEEARKNNVTGTVRLRALLSSSGSVTNISAIKGLPDGLTERAIAAARQIRFVPAQKDGRNVSMWVTLEYSFNIY